MSGFTMTEWIPRAPQEVFDFVTTPDNAPRVVPSVTRVVPLTGGPVGVGTRFRETRLVRGKEQHAELEVTAYRPHESYAVANATQGIETVYRYSFRPEGPGTRVDLVCEVSASGAKRLMVPVVVAVLRREDGRHLQEVKRALEA
jgi:uncharacterized protein YndB with AHSA1/START domain